MPSQPRASTSTSKSRTATAAEEPDITSHLTEHEPVTKVGKKKSKHASTKQNEFSDKAPDTQSEITIDQSPPQSFSVLNQIPRTFPSPRRPSTEDVLEELNATEKVSDEHTPPQHVFLPSATDGRTPPSELIPGLSYAVSPPTQHSYIGKGGFNARSPPVLPPQTKARPASYGGPPSVNYGHPRLSTSPYGHAPSAYGSPPALPHMPQQHFYNAQDIDLGLGAPTSNIKVQSRTFLKFAHLPGSSPNDPDALFAGSDSHLDVFSYDGEKISNIGSTPQLPGVPHDATFLTWSSGNDPFHEFRPLVAVAIHDATSLEHDVEEQASSRQFYAVPQEARPLIVSIVVYSLTKRIPVAELLRVPASLLQHPPLGYSEPAHQPLNKLSLRASGNYLAVCSGLSGEVFVFGVSQDESGPKFECLTKLWTSLQPRLSRRDSSHSRPARADLSSSPTDGGRGQREDLRPIISLNGRWLAYCPATVSTISIGASLGDSVARSHVPTIASKSAPSRSTVNCDVESPDAETLLSKVAKGAAQGILRGSKWLGEMGMQAWRTWNADLVANPQPQPSHTSLVYPPQTIPNQFPPTHADPVDMNSADPDLVSIIDLALLQNREHKKSMDGIMPLATFQPPGGCSFLSFAPNGLSLLTASKRGDCQYIWDLFQIRYPRMTLLSHDAGSNIFASKVRQLAKYERFSPSMVVDVQWERSLGHRFAIFTQNRTIHMFDVPAAALRWPPPRQAKRSRPTSAPAEKPDAAPQPQGAAAWMASARNLAGRTQPMLATLRGRAPSVAGGVSGIGASGIGLASATGMRGGKVVAAGFSKSLGAATDTVAHIRHAGQSKLHLKVEAEPDRLVWRIQEGRTALCILDVTGVKNYYVRKTNPREGQMETVSVFDARKAVAHRLPDIFGPTLENLAIQDENVAEGVGRMQGFWKPDKSHLAATGTITAPLSHAEIDTNAPYQPFHSNHRVSMSVYVEGRPMTESQLPAVSAIFQPHTRQNQPPSSDRWVFGRNIPTAKLAIAPPELESDLSAQDSVVYRGSSIVAPVEDNKADQAMDTSKKRKAKKRASEMNNNIALENQQAFFEDDLDVLDTTEDRV